MCADRAGRCTSQPAISEYIDDIDELREVVDDPFVRWCLPRTGFQGAWRVGTHLLVAFDRHRRRAVPGPWLLLLGDSHGTPISWDLVPELLGTVPGSITVSSTLAQDLPRQWQLQPAPAWDFMSTKQRIDGDGLAAVSRVTETAAIQSLLDAGNPGAHARPGDPDVVGWWGEYGWVEYEPNGLACVGALTKTDWNGAHLRAITTDPGARGRGCAGRVSAELTNQGLASLSDEVTLGVYSDNAAAIRLYERLGYRRVHQLISFA